MSRRIFLDSVERYALQAGRKLGVPVVPKAVAAQAALESDWGRSRLAREASNLFGLKAGVSWDGSTIELPTWEILDGHRVETVARFRRYAGFAESVEDYVATLRLPWYADAVQAARHGDPYGFVYGLVGSGGEPGWATDPAYSDKILGIMQRYGLLRGPHPLWTELVYIDGREVAVGAASVGYTADDGLKLWLRLAEPPAGLLARLSAAWRVLVG